jgi:hypothetical protein
MKSNDDDVAQSQTQTTPTKELLKALLKEVLYNSFAQAIIKIILTPHLTLKLFLGIFVLASSGLASYLVINTLITFLSFGVSTTTRTINETPTLFPKITFCNVNSYATEYAYNFTRQTGLLNGGTLPDEDKKKLGHNLEDILISCSHNALKCNATNFTWSFDKVYGNCYTFNSGFDSSGNRMDLKQTSVAGAPFGLNLMFYVNVYERLFSIASSPPLVDSLGAIIRIGNSSYSTFHTSPGILVSPGYHTNIVVKRHFKTILPEPFSNCKIDSSSLRLRPDEDFYNLIGQSEYSYSREYCFSLCLQNYIINNYNCSLNTLPLLYNMSICDSSLTNRILYIDKVPTLMGTIINEICLPLCRLECNQTLYETSVSFKQLIGAQYKAFIMSKSNLLADFINRSLDLTQIEKSIVRVNIYYESLSYTLSSELPQMDIVALLANIGGNLGLFLGVSFFSLCELVEMMIEAFFILKASNKIKTSR